MGLRFGPAVSAAILAGLASSGLLVAIPARSESLEEKLCLFLAAERLPAVPGLAIESATVNGAPPRSVVPALVAYFPEPLRAYDELNRRFGLPTGGERDIAFRRLVARGETEAAKTVIVETLNGVLVGGARAEIGIRAAGREATYGYVCAWRSLKDVVAAPLGLVR